MREVRVGTCGFCLRQQDYFRTFPVIEIQQTFYQPPRVATAERWRRSAPDGFEFALKAFQAITHRGFSPTYRRCNLSEAERAECGSFRDTPVVRAAWETTRVLAATLRARFVVFQCPATFRPTERDVASLRWFFGWARRDGLVFGWEPRGPAWTNERVHELCRELDLIHVVDPFLGPPAYGTPAYFRLHGIGGYEYRYSDEELQRVLQACTAPLTYCLFNNTNMLEDARRFEQLVSRSATHLLTEKAKGPATLFD